MSANGLIAAQHIGTTYIDVNEETRIEVTVKPLVTAFVEPPLLFGATRSEVIAKVGDNYSSLDDTVLTYVRPNEKVVGVKMEVDGFYLGDLTTFLRERYRCPYPMYQDYNTYYNVAAYETPTMVITENLSASHSSTVYYSPYPLPY